MGSSVEEAEGGEGGEWVEYFDEEVGAKYYYNTINGEASWIKPAGL